jgi:hypothetical protein
MNSLEPAIYYCENNHLYNYPFILRYSDGTETTIDFYFHEEDYPNQSVMLADRMVTIVSELLKTAMPYYTELQEICLVEPDLSDENADAISKRIEELLEVLYYFCKLIFSKYEVLNHALESGIVEEGQIQPIQKHIWADFWEDLMQNFELLPDYFPEHQQYKIRSSKSLFDKLEVVKCVEECCQH